VLVLGRVTLEPIELARDFIVKRGGGIVVDVFEDPLLDEAVAPLAHGSLLAFR
jgi:hypothetical protein